MFGLLFIFIFVCNDDVIAIRCNSCKWILISFRPSELSLIVRRPYYRGALKERSACTKTYRSWKVTVQNPCLSESSPLYSARGKSLPQNLNVYKDRFMHFDLCAYLSANWYRPAHLQVTICGRHFPTTSTPRLKIGPVVINRLHDRFSESGKIVGLESRARWFAICTSRFISPFYVPDKSGQWNGESKLVST